MPESTAESLFAALDRAGRVLITTHVKPDGDALGSASVLALALKQRGKHVELLLLSKCPSKYSFVLKEAGLFEGHHDAEAGAIPDLAAFDTVAITDTGTWSQLPGLKEKLEAFISGGNGRQVVVIDHHRTQEGWGTVRVVDAGRSSACELVWDLMRQWGVRATKEMADAAYIGLVSDTGWFQFSNATPSTLRLAADLMEAGANPDLVYQRLYQSEREPRLRLQARVMNGFELHAGGTLAVLKVRAADFAATGANVNDTENLINLPLALASVEMSLCFSEPMKADGSPIRVSLRSKGKVDVSAFAQKFGGGGHSRAAGLKLDGDFDAEVGRVVAAAVMALKADKATTDEPR